MILVALLARWMVNRANGELGVENCRLGLHLVVSVKKHTGASSLVVLMSLTIRRGWDGSVSRLWHSCGAALIMRLNDGRAAGDAW